jgi:hypothetical protein
MDDNRASRSQCPTRPLRTSHQRTTAVRVDSAIAGVSNRGPSRWPFSRRSSAAGVARAWPETTAIRRQQPGTVARARSSHRSDAWKAIGRRDCCFPRIQERGGRQSRAGRRLVVVRSGRPGRPRGDARGSRNGGRKRSPRGRAAGTQQTLPPSPSPPPASHNELRVICSPTHRVWRRMFRASHGTTIARDSSAVFDYVADAGRQQSWNALVRSMDRDSEGQLGVGTRWRGEIARVGRVDVELIEYDRPRRVGCTPLAHGWPLRSTPGRFTPWLAGAAWCSTVRCGQWAWAGCSRRSCR